MYNKKTVLVLDYDHMYVWDAIASNGIQGHCSWKGIGGKL